MQLVTDRGPWQWLEIPLISQSLRSTDCAAMAYGGSHRPSLANRVFGALVEETPCARGLVDGMRIEFEVLDGLWSVDGVCTDCSHRRECVVGIARHLARRTRDVQHSCSASVAVPSRDGPRSYRIETEHVDGSDRDLALVFARRQLGTAALEAPALAQFDSSRDAGSQELSSVAEMPHSRLDPAALGLVLDRVNAGVIVSDTGGHLLYFNDCARQILGMGARAVPMRAWSELYGVFEPDQSTPRPSSELPLARALRGETVNHDLLFIRNPRLLRDVWIDASSWPLVDSSGAVSGGVVVFEDTTGEHRNRQRLSRMYRAVEQTTEAILMTDPAGAIEYANPAFERLTGYSSSDVRGRRPSILKSGRHGAGFYRDMWKLLSSGRPFTGTLINRRKDGTRFWAELSISPVLNRGVVTNYVSVMRDITAERRARDLDHQMTLAAEIQERFYQSKLALDGFDVAGTTLPTSITAGDYFDLVRLPGPRWLLLIADVSGHGFGAALVMAESRAYTRGLASSYTDPADLLHRLNRRLVADLPANQYVTLMAVEIDPREPQLRYAGAGHLPGQILRHGSSDFESLSSCGPPLGMLTTAKYETRATRALGGDDILVMLTDGIIESGLPHGADFGMGRTLECVREHRDESSAAIIELLMQRARAYQGVVPRHDDMSAVICRRLPAS